MATILIIDDDSIMSYTLARMVQHMGHTSVTAFSLREGLACFQKQSFDAVFLDVRLPDGNGLKIIPELRSVPDPPDIIILTGYGDCLGAELALKSGVWDYLEKPSSVSQMKLPLLRLLEYRKQKQAAQTPVSIDRGGIVGSSVPMTYCVDLMARAAIGEANVLISGETGTGKELFARAIHRNSRRSRMPFVVVDCAALPERLVESILFGHARGAYTGADQARDGLVKQADGGTLMLDEIGELTPSLQKAFLRVLQEHRFRPVGGKTEQVSQFRLIAATHRDLDELTQTGDFRIDLLHRIRTLSIELPPLRERQSDIEELIHYHLGKLSARYKMTPKGFSPEFISTLTAYPWPGNVRELVNALESALNAAIYEPILFPVHLPPNLRAHVARVSIRTSLSPPGSLDRMPKWRDVLDETRKTYLEKMIERTGGDMVRMQRISGWSRASLYNYLKKYEIDLTAGK